VHISFPGGLRPADLHDSLHCAPERAKCGEHFGIAEVRIAAARIWEDEHARTVDRRALKTQADCRDRRSAKRSPQRPIQRDAHEGDDFGPELLDLFFQNLPALEILSRP
jgi:hypothetical protein